MEKKEHNAEIDKEKKIKNSSFIDAWKNAINGIIYATTTQANIKKTVGNSCSSSNYKLIF